VPIRIIAIISVFLEFLFKNDSYCLKFLKNGNDFGSYRFFKNQWWFFIINALLLKNTHYAVFYLIYA